MPERRVDPFPVRPYKSGEWVIPGHFIPWYLAEYVYARMVAANGPMPPIEYIAQQGGFSAAGYMDLMAGGDGNAPYKGLHALVSSASRSMLNEVQVVVPGTKAFDEACREFESEVAEKERNTGRMTFGSAGVFGGGQAVARGEMWKKGK